MLLINKSKTMIKFYITLVVILASIIAGGYYYLSSMKTIQGGLNINKIENINKIYTSSVYSDFYFRIINYKADATTFATFVNSVRENSIEVNKIVNGYYSELLPLKVSIGYDFENIENPQFILQNIDVPSKENSTSEVAKQGEGNDQYIEKIREFKDTYSKIVATQDQAYFDKSLYDTKTILQEMFTDKNITLERKNVNDFYTSLDIPINNLTMKYFKLEYFKLKNFMKRKVWQPYLAVWTYGDSKIYLQYIKQEESNTLLDLNEKMKHEDGELVIKMVKINNNEIVPIYLRINKKNNEMSTYAMSKDGQTYLLKMVSDTRSSLLNTIDDFLKLSSGISFNESATNKWLVKQEEEVKMYFEKCKKLITDIHDLQEEEKSHIVSFYGDSNENFEIFKKHFDSYPSEKIYNMLNKEYVALKKRKGDDSLFSFK